MAEGFSPVDRLFCWVGGALSLVLLFVLRKNATDGGVLYGIYQSIQHVDLAIVAYPGAMGCLITGFIYSLFTPWGFFKHNWMIVKWIVTVTAIVSGTFFLGPWEASVVEISGRLGMAAIDDPNYTHKLKMNVIFGSLQALVILITVFISILKPWKRKKTGARLSGILGKAGPRGTGCAGLLKKGRL